MNKKSITLGILTLAISSLSQADPPAPILDPATQPIAQNTPPNAAPINPLVAQLITSLSSDNVTLRSRAASRLVRMGEQSRPALNQLLNGNDPDLKLRAARILRLIDGKGLPGADNPAGNVAAGLPLSVDRTIKVQHGQQTITIHETDAGIDMTVDAKDPNNQPISEEFKAKSANELQTEFPEAFALYEQASEDELNLSMEQNMAAIQGQINQNAAAPNPQNGLARQGLPGANGAPGAPGAPGFNAPNAFNNNPNFNAPNNNLNIDAINAAQINAMNQMAITVNQNMADIAAAMQALDAQNVAQAQAQAQAVDPAPMVLNRRGIVINVNPNFDPDNNNNFAPAPQTDLPPAGTVGELMKYVGHTDAVNAVALNAAVTRLFSAGDDKTLRVWDAHSAREIQKLDANPGGVSVIALAPDQTQLITGGKDGSLITWNFANGVVTKNAALDAGTDAVNAAAYSPDSSKLLTGGDDQIVRLFDTHTGKEIFHVKIPNAAVTSVAFSPDGKTAAVGDDEHVIHLFDLDKHAEFAALKSRGAKINALSYSPDGKKLAAACGTYSPTQNQAVDAVVHVWDLTTRTETAQLTCPDVVNAVSYTPDGKRLVAASSDKTIKIWDAASGKLIQSLEGHSAEVNALVLSPDGKYAASAGADKTARLWGLPK